jgi:hypothetical protein
MKKSLCIAIAALLLAGGNLNAWAQDNLNYYWVAGAGNWNTPGNWRAGTSLATAQPTQILPNATNNVIFTNSPFVAASGTGQNRTPASTVTVDAPGAVCRDMIWTGARNVPNFQINSALTIAGSLTYITGMNVAAGPSASATFTAANRATITSAGKSFDLPVVFNGGAAGQWILADNMTINVSARFLSGYVVALPLPTPTPATIDPNIGLVGTPTDPTTEVTGSPRFRFAAAATVSGASHASHVVGYVEKAVVSGTPGFEFPIGNGMYYRPLITVQASSGNTLLARYFSTNPAKPISNTEQYVNSVPSAWSRIQYDPRTTVNSVSNQEFWYFDASANSSPGFRINANHPDPAINQYMRLDRWAGLTVAGVSTDSSKPPVATWSDMNPNGSSTVTPSFNPATGVTDYWVSAGGVSNSNNWLTFGRRGATPLPVRLVSFTGQQLAGQVQLKWQSASEENTSHFEVEKSADGKNFSQVLTKKAQGNSATLVSYNAVDNNPLAGTSYYRLKMVDLDGTFEYSKLVAVSAEGTLAVRAYPNPSKGNGISIVAGDGSKLVLKSISDLFGKQVGYQAGNAAGEGLQVNFAQPLPAGFYVATLTGSDNGQLVKVKFVVQ